MKQRKTVSIVAAGLLSLGSFALVGCHNDEPMRHDNMNAGAGEPRDMRPGVDGTAKGNAGNSGAGVDPSGNVGASSPGVTK